MHPSLVNSAKVLIGLRLFIVFGADDDVEQ